jgi:hypothetical protein
MTAVRNISPSDGSSCSLCFNSMGSPGCSSYSEAPTLFVVNRLVRLFSRNHCNIVHNPITVGHQTERAMGFAICGALNRLKWSKHLQ